MNEEAIRRHLECDGLGSLIEQMNDLILKNPNDIKQRKGEAFIRYKLIIREIDKRYGPAYVPDSLIP